MKTQLKLQCFLLGLAAFACLLPKASAQMPQKFKVIPESVKQGDEVTIEYQPDKINVPVTGAVYLFKNYQWEGHDLPLIKRDSTYTSTYTIPEGTALVCYRFWLGDSLDVGTRFPYAFLVHNNTGKKLAPGAYSEWGLFRVKGSDGNMMPIVSKTAEIEPKVLVGLWVGKEIGDINVARNMLYDMARGIKTYPAAHWADSVITLMGNKILNLPDVTEREMIAVERTYGNILRKSSAADSVRGLILLKYPNGLRRRIASADSIYFERKPEERLRRLERFMIQYPFNNYPYRDYLNVAVGNPSFFYNGYSGVVKYLFAQKRFDEMKRLINVGPYNMLNDYYIHFVDFPFHATTPMISVEEQLDLSTFIINNLIQRGSEKDDVTSGRGYIAPSEWTKVIVADNRSFIAYHANLLFNNKQYAEAMKYATLVKPYIKYGDIKFNTLYAKLLDHEMKTAEAKIYMEAAIKANSASPELIALLKTYYIKDHKSEIAFEKYYAALVPGKNIEEMHEQLKKSLIHIPAANFNLRNLKGEDVDLASQKGKVVVLDFWASWCFPCKAAMPGMETLVKKYKTDSNVQFYFISTLEESPNYKKQVADFVSAKKYDFNVLFDKIAPGAKKNSLVFDSYAKLLHLNGIPQKVVIDGDGYIRWTADGFDGDLIKLTNEVDYIISLIKQDKSK